MLPAHQRRRAGGAIARAGEKEREKAWKLAVGDWKERERWDEYTRACEAALTRCAPPELPWHVVPADKKCYRNYVVLETIVRRGGRSQWPRS